MTTVRGRQALLAVTLLVVEVAIAKGIIPGAWVRHSLGDVLVIPLVYFVLRAVTGWRAGVALVLSLGLGLAVELAQLLRFAERMGFAPGSIPHTVLGATFSGWDLVMYAMGGVVAWWVDSLVCTRTSAG